MKRTCVLQASCGQHPQTVCRSQHTLQERWCDGLRSLFVGCTRQETEKELNVMARLPAWAKGKSVRLELGKTHIKLFLKEEEDKPIIEVGAKRQKRLLTNRWSTIQSAIGTVQYSAVLIALTPSPSHRGKRPDVQLSSKLFHWYRMSPLKIINETTTVFDSLFF